MRWNPAFVFRSCLVLLLCWSALPRPSVAEVVRNDHPAVATYKKFAGAFIRGRLSEARRLAKGETLRIIARQEILIEKGPPPPPIVDSQFMIFAEQFSEEGRKLRLNALHVVQTGGADSLYTPPRLHRQDVTLHEGNEGWRVVRFKDNLEKCCLP